jgi:hypothetical protein
VKKHESSLLEVSSDGSSILAVVRVTPLSVYKVPKQINASRVEILRDLPVHMGATLHMLACGFHPTAGLSLRTPPKSFEDFAEDLQNETAFSAIFANSAYGCAINK